MNSNPQTYHVDLDANMDTQHDSTLFEAQNSPPRQRARRPGSAPDLNSPRKPSRLPVKSDQDAATNSGDQKKAAKTVGATSKELDDDLARFESVKFSCAGEPLGQSYLPSIGTASTKTLRRSTLKIVRSKIPKTPQFLETSVRRSSVAQMVDEMEAKEKDEKKEVENLRRSCKTTEDQLAQTKKTLQWEKFHREADQRRWEETTAKSSDYKAKYERILIEFAESKISLENEIEECKEYARESQIELMNTATILAEIQQSHEDLLEAHVEEAGFWTAHMQEFENVQIENKILKIRQRELESETAELVSCQDTLTTREAHITRVEEENEMLQCRLLALKTTTEALVVYCRTSGLQDDHSPLGPEANNDLNRQLKDTQERLATANRQNFNLESEMNEIETEFLTLSDSLQEYQAKVKTTNARHEAELQTQQKYFYGIVASLLAEIVDLQARNTANVEHGRSGSDATLSAPFDTDADGPTQLANGKLEKGDYIGNIPKYELKVEDLAVQLEPESWNKGGRVLEIEAVRTDRQDFEDRIRQLEVQNKALEMRTQVGYENDLTLQEQNQSLVMSNVALASESGRLQSALSDAIAEIQALKSSRAEIVDELVKEILQF
jgi:molecular chaperone GrpE (heat shock protein)